MIQFSSDDYSTLKSTLLEMWVPIVGVHTPADLWTKNYVKAFCSIVKMDNFPTALQNKMKRTNEEFCKRSVFKTNFQSFFDTQPPFQLSEAILTGSLSEGLFLYSLEPPDMDIMCVLKNITFSQEDQKNGSLQLREDTPFVYAFVTKKETQQLWGEFFYDVGTQAGKHRLSSRKLKEKLQDNYQKTSRMFHTMGEEELEQINEGAAATVRKPKPSLSSFQYFVEIFQKLLRQPVNELYNLHIDRSQFHDDMLYQLVPSSDIVLSIYCEGWPSCAREWMTRERLWPQIHSVEKITQSGFHIVPKSSSDGDFRLSFSGAESMLIETLLPLQHRVMRAFKAVVKYHENTWSPNLKDIISSYHLKTIAFWHFEKSSQKSWTEETLVHHLVTLLQEFAEALRIQNLPMYFMPKFNLLQDVDDPEVTLDLMEKISQLAHNFSAISEAVHNCNTLKLLFATASDHYNLANIFVTLREEKLKKAQENCEVSFTFYDVFVAMEKLVNR
ncbi:Hypothetical predicted protein [Paramuricea clavata]|uniref:Uncharacterized protein n=1 Tax=Paramuricea clavata TaxID=317549 RepID=A0A7D9HM28_PARCT|nr:Hypothetical predicted protein [Paramuricea clavata]